MTQKRISAAEGEPVRVVLITLDAHMAEAARAAETRLSRDLPGTTISFHVATDWARDPDALARCKADIARGDIIVANMLFMENHIEPVLEDLTARRAHCDAMVGAMAGAEIVRLTRLGRFSMDGSGGGVIQLLKRLRGSRGKGGTGHKASSGAKQMAMLRRLPKILRYVPGTAQDVRAYFLAMQYLLASSEENIANLVRFLVRRYASGPRAHLRGTIEAAEPTEYPDTGLYHPRMRGRIGTDRSRLPKPSGKVKGRVGLLVMRSYVLAGDTGHYDGVIAALEARGLEVVPAFASGLDARPAARQFFFEDGERTIDALVSLTGFSLVGGPAYNDAHAAEALLEELDVPYLSAQALEFETVEEWRESDAGLSPVEATMMVAIPEIDGATGPIVFGGRSGTPAADGSRRMVCDDERAETLAGRVEKLIALRKTPAAERHLAITLFNFPPNAGAVGTAANLAVFPSLMRTLKALKAEGYSVDLPADEDDLRQRLVDGNRERHGTPANVHARIDVDAHVRSEPHLAEIEAAWGPAPGRQLTDGRSIFVMGARFGNVFVGLQPAFGYEGDPMRLLFEKNFAPTHAFSAFYRYLRQDFGADAVLHFGTHGALEFMPGKQVGLGATCWPDRLIGDLPNLYLYAGNNPSEATVAKRRSAATTVSYRAPALAKAGLYRGLGDLRGSIARWRQLVPENRSERAALVETIQAQAAELDLASSEPAWNEPTNAIDDLRVKLDEIEQTLVPHGLHVLGETAGTEEKLELLEAIAGLTLDGETASAFAQAVIDGQTAEAIVERFGEAADDAALHELATRLITLDRDLGVDHEIAGLMHALEGGFTPPVKGGDVMRAPETVPAGRNIHGFDPFAIPSAFAVGEGRAQAERLIARHCAAGESLPETVAMVLWGTDNLKNEGGPLAQAMALMGARPRCDGFGRLAGAELIPLADLGRPRIDVLVTVSGIFRDLLPLQTRLLAEAAFMAASVDEPEAQNFVRKHALAYAATEGCDFETAALRVFSNAEGAYGSNVNMLVDSGAWGSEGELAETYLKRKCFAYDRNGACAERSAVLKAALADVALTYQNLESVELGVTTIDHYFDTLGGISRAAREARGGEAVPVYIGDQTRGTAGVRTLSEQVSLESRTRMLNPKWIEGMLAHGYEGVRQIEGHVTNTLGWSATTGAVEPWIYRRVAETFLLDPEMRERLARLNPTASARMANRLVEAQERDYWQPGPEELEALRDAHDDLEDRLEGISMEVAA
ncbi:magnesium chelatase subunit H [Pararhizobium mangrovi]|uniref:magnesium chelatase n=1 Tax=Pararhizobium mangrovi TaxID=2590452 RepID=A0A506U7V0_9HYPH|nr:magnesium chelatase subunit H [Pararhizobium mangrovi]TPW30423.1 magnesium chelatase subunit H [Pararhizobium mangrovi]